MDNVVFVNQFITNGITTFVNGSSEHIFEKHVIEVLCHIYGRNNIVQAFEDKNEKIFAHVVESYGFPQNLYDNFLDYTAGYSSYLELGEGKTDTIEKIENLLIKMYKFKSAIIDLTEEDKSTFENLLLKDFEVKKLVFDQSLNPNKTEEIWLSEKKKLDNRVILEEVKPELLDEFTYAKFGVSKKDVEKMDYRMIARLNEYIESKLSDQEEDNKKPEKINLNTFVTSGNGFVDALLIIAIIAAEFSVGLIYLFLHI